MVLDIFYGSAQPTFLLRAQASTWYDRYQISAEQNSTIGYAALIHTHSCSFSSTATHVANRRPPLIVLLLFLLLFFAAVTATSPAVNCFCSCRYVSSCCYCSSCHCFVCCLLLPLLHHRVSSCYCNFCVGNCWSLGEEVHEEEILLRQTRSGGKRDLADLRESLHKSWKQQRIGIGQSIETEKLERADQQRCARTIRHQKNEHRSRTDGRRVPRYTYQVVVTVHYRAYPKRPYTS